MRISARSLRNGITCLLCTKGDQSEGWRLKFAALPCVRVNQCNDISVDNVVMEYCNIYDQIPNADQVRVLEYVLNVYETLLA